MTFFTCVIGVRNLPVRSLNSFLSGLMRGKCWKPCGDGLKMQRRNTNLCCGWAILGPMRGAIGGKRFRCGLNCLRERFTLRKKSSRVGLNRVACASGCVGLHDSGMGEDNCPARHVAEAAQRGGVGSMISKGAGSPAILTL